jgi:hypothetical protein
MNLELACRTQKKSEAFLPAAGGDFLASLLPSEVLNFFIKEKVENIYYE